MAGHPKVLSALLLRQSWILLHVRPQRCPIEPAGATRARPLVGQPVRGSHPVIDTRSGDLKPAGRFGLAPATSHKIDSPFA